MGINARQVIRGLTAVLLVGIIAGLAGLAVYRAGLKRPAKTEMGAEEVFGSDGSPAVGVYTGFKHMERVEGRLVFAIEALRTLGQSSGWHDIESVSLQLFEDGGEEGPVLTCRHARYNIASGNAELEGSVQVEFPDGSFLATEVAGFIDGGQRFETHANLAFVGNGVFGNAGAADYDFSTDVLRLEQGVIVQGNDGSVLEAPDVVYRRNEERIVLPSGASIEFGSFSLEAPSGIIQLDPETGEPADVRFGGGVQVEGHNLETDQVIRVSTEWLVARRDAAARWQIEAMSPEHWVDAQIIGGRDHLVQHFRAWNLRGVAGERGIVNLRGDGRVCFELIPYEGFVRRGEGREARIWFENGVANNIELTEHVELSQEGQSVSAHQVRIDSDSGMVMLRGNPVGDTRVTARLARGTMAADQMVLNRQRRETEMYGNVQGQMSGVRLVASGEAQEEPVHLAADRVTVLEDGSSYVARNNARVWQGQRLLVGDEIRYTASLERLEARGHVRTAFPVALLEPGSTSPEDVVLESRTMAFEARDQGATYSGNVILTHPAYLLKAQGLEIFFDDEGQLRSVVATGAVAITDFSSGRQLTGRQAVRDIVTGVVRLTGDPAQALDREGNMLSGRTLTWDQAGGRVAVTDDTETIFHPEDES